MVNHSLFPPIVVNGSAGDPRAHIAADLHGSAAAQQKLNHQHGGSDLIVPQPPGGVGGGSVKAAEIFARLISNSQYDDTQHGGSIMNRLELLLSKNAKTQKRKKRKNAKTQKRKKRKNAKTQKTQKRKKNENTNKK
jgi:hypothetical protein